ncbi:cytochrome c [Spiribacter sp. 221]|uniref:c-type cytochrome n=1 Tax=Spiribacter onubensis TaxID=3122420 RepID=UPI00349FA20F
MSQHNDQQPEPQRTPLKESGFEPYEVNRPIPILVLAVTVALIAWGVYTLWADSGPSTEAAAEAEAPIAGIDTAPTIADNASSLVSAGATIFAANCATCHQANGSGISEAVPPLVDSRYVTGAADTPVQILLHGIKGPIEVAGNQYDGRMPRFGETLTDSEIAAVVSYIRQQWGNSAAFVEPAFVAEQRARFVADRGPWNGGAELEQVTGVPARLARATDTEASQ